MKAPLVRIGNSRGVRIPKSIIEQCGLKDEVEITIRDNALVITSAVRARDGWAEAFARAAPTSDNTKLMPDDLSHRWDEAEWKW